MTAMDKARAMSKARARSNRKFCELTDAKLEYFRAHERAMMTAGESRYLRYLRTSLCLHTELLRHESVGRTDKFCASFSFRIWFTSLASKGAGTVRGGVLKSTLVVDNGRQFTMYMRTQSLSVPQS